MGIVDEIRECFASIKITGAREITALPYQYPGYAIRTPEGYGVAIEVNNDMVTSEKFNGCRFYTGLIGIEGITNNYLILSSPFEEFRYEFAAICAEFLDPGDDGINRMKLLSDPISWWMNWRELIGNTSREQRVYSVLAEMNVLAHKLDSDSKAEWTVLTSGSHDIECENESCEVKSTIKRYGATVTISGQHQLEHVKPLWLYFCRMEESMEGKSINDIKEILLSKGYNEAGLEIKLEKLGFEKGTSIRNKKFKILEKRKYLVDESFPKITKESFKEDKFPDSIVHIEYTVDLDGIEYTTW